MHRSGWGSHLQAAGGGAGRAVMVSVRALMVGELFPISFVLLISVTRCVPLSEVTMPSVLLHGDFWLWGCNCGV